MRRKAFLTRPLTGDLEISVSFQTVACLLHFRSLFVELRKVEIDQCCLQSFLAEGAGKREGESRVEQISLQLCRSIEVNWIW